MPKRMASTPRTTSDHQIPDTIFESISLSHFLLRLTHVSRTSHARLGWLWAVAHASQAHPRHTGSTSVPHRFHIGSIRPLRPCGRRALAAVCDQPSLFRPLFRPLFLLCWRERALELGSACYRTLLAAWVWNTSVSYCGSLPGKPAHDHLNLVEVYPARQTHRFSHMTASLFARRGPLNCMIHLHHVLLVKEPHQRLVYFRGVGPDEGM